MNLLFTEASGEDYLYWQQTDKKVLKTVNQLLEAIKRNPFEGIGKPEPLKYQLAGCWSRHIKDEQRLTYEVKGETIKVITCRYHYGK